VYRMLSINVLLQPHVFNSFFIQKLRVRVIYECVLYSNKYGSFGVILAHVAWPRAQPLGQSISLKFSLETRLESESFEPLNDFLAFLVQKLLS